MFGGNTYSALLRSRIRLPLMMPQNASATSKVVRGHYSCDPQNLQCTASWSCPSRLQLEQARVETCCFWARMIQRKTKCENQVKKTYFLTVKSGRGHRCTDAVTEKNGNRCGYQLGH